MYRLFKLRNIQIQKFQNLSVSYTGENDVLNGPGRACSLCKNLNNYSRTFIRNQSTISSPNITSKKARKKRIKSNKKYAELLVVNDNSTSHHRAFVQKLTSNDLRLLASTNLNLSELYKIKQLYKSDNKFVLEHTYNNLTIIDNLPVITMNETSFDISVSASDILNNFESTNCNKNVITCNIPLPSTNILPDLTNFNLNNSNSYSSISEKVDFLPDIATILDPETDIIDSVPKNINTFQPAILEEHPEIIETEPEEPKELFKEKLIKPVLDRRATEEVVTRTLASYLEICSNLNLPLRGLNALHFHKGKVKRLNDKYFIPIKKINVYNAIMKGFSSKSNFQKVLEVIDIIRSESVEFNVQSYIIIFECLGRINIQDNHLKEIRIFGKEAKQQGITFDKMMNEGTFLNDERNVVLKAMQSYDPNYLPKYDEPNLQYSNHLVNELNCTQQLEVPEEIPKFLKNNGLFTQDSMHSAIKKQLELEKDTYVTVKSIELKSEPTEEVLRFRQVLKDQIKMWEESALTAFNRDLLTLTARRSALNFEPYMRSIPARDFIKIIVDEAVKLAQGSETYSPTVNQLYREMGGKVYARYKVLRKMKTGVLDKVHKIHKNYCLEYAINHPLLDIEPSQEYLLNTRQQWQWIEYKYKSAGATLSMDHQEWVPTVLAAIGKFLYHIVMHDLKVDVNSMKPNKHKNYLPAFYTIFRTQGRIVKEEVKPHPVLSKLYRASMPETLTFPTSELPMLCPPLPWISVYQGGYLVSPCEMIRLPTQASSQKQRLEETKPEQLYPSLDALNQLGAVPWKVNEKILDVILEVFNNGGSSKLDVPEPPSSLPLPPMITNEMDKAEKYHAFKQKLQHRRKKAEMYSLWCDCLYRLSLANHFRNEIFWLPHNMDFRGRVYPIPPHLNHLGSDLARSMLVFAESRPLGPKGLDWLKIHLINLTGLKKRDPVSIRLEYANEIMDDILDSADNPLTGKKWWAESDEPWQTLACCIEISQAIRSPDPEKYRSHFPVHQDGSCNGLQHYAALGRDSAGAFSVNLTSSKEPQDVYSAVVSLVEKQRQKDAENGVEVAKILDGFVKRKVIKQTIMTTVYGVTRFGARLQIARQLKDIDEFPKDMVWSASSYLTVKTFESLRTMFTSTREIQDWFTECARLISAVGGQHVEWVTPMGLPIVQPYFKFKKLNSSMVYESFHMDKYEKPNVMKQKNAFPPNFIHSLDSSHMMLTSLFCERKGITFVSVHDCYWTHPSTVHIMNKVCRNQFVALHSEPILEDLSVFLTEKYSYNDDEFLDDGSVIDLTRKKLNRILRKLPRTGDFDINQVLDSVYFFS